RTRRRGRDPQRALLQRDPFHHGRHRRRHRLLRRGDRRARQRLRRDHRRPALRGPADDGGGPHPPRLRVPGRRRVRRRHGVPRVQAERYPRREERRARVSRDLAGVWLTEAAGFGGYAVGLLTVAGGWPAWLAVLVGPWAAVLVGTILFVPILKTRGHYLALVTIAFVFIFNILVNNLEFTGGPQGIKNIPTLSLGGYAFTTRPALAGVELPAHANFYYAALVMAGLTTWVLRRLHDSWLGLVLNTLRDDEIAARCCGVSVTRGKLLAFSIGNFFIGLGGAFYAVVVGFVSPPDFDFGYSLVMLSVIIIG